MLENYSGLLKAFFFFFLVLVFYLWQIRTLNRDVAVRLERERAEKLKDDENGTEKS